MYGCSSRPFNLSVVPIRISIFGYGTMKGVQGGVRERERRKGKQNVVMFHCVFHY